ncbi:hypothetical protein DSO57_1034598 [Entomophthora muscae]|uniref:Uncharacterized protein n=1 Tax=Entomophthora muscae TaxID=34485 RepID=A0ACC2REH0_9FUNG|nr:hypothetical protein DSO57_1034598 [Entomophthora muscae]
MKHIQSLEDKPSYMSYKPPEIFQNELGYKSTSASIPIAEQCTIPKIMMAILSNPSASRQAPPQNTQCSSLSSQTSLQTLPLQNTGKRFKVGVLPKFDCQGNMHTFLRLYKMATVGAPDTKKTYLIINLLDPMSRDIIMPSLPAGNITYQDARSDILREFGSTVHMIEFNDLFSYIKFKTNKTLSEFADQFHHKAQVLLGAGAMVEHNAKLTMKNAVKSYQELYWAMNLFLGQEFTMVQILDYLCRLKATHNAPNKEKPRYNHPVNTNTPAISSTKTCQTQERLIPLTDITCYCCWNKGHYATKCPNGQKVHVVYIFAKEQEKDQAQKKRDILLSLKSTSLPITSYASLSASAQQQCCNCRASQPQSAMP